MEDVIQKAKDRLLKIEAEAIELRAFLRTYTKLVRDDDNSRQAHLVPSISEGQTITCQNLWKDSPYINQIVESCTYFNKQHYLFDHVTTGVVDDHVFILERKTNVNSRDEIVSAARKALKESYPNPMPIGDLFDKLISDGIRIGGQNPKGNLSAKLAPPTDLKYVRDHGWYFVPKRNEPPKGGSDTDEVVASSFDRSARNLI